MNPDAMKAGSDKLLHAVTMAQEGKWAMTGLDLIWKPHKAGNLYPAKPGCESRKVTESQLAKIAERDRTAEENRTNRDPCFKCGVRADYGCKHR